MPGHAGRKWKTTWKEPSNSHIIPRACAKKPFFGTASAQCCYTPAENLKLARNFFRLRVIFLDYSVFGHTCPVFGTTYF